MKRSAGPAVALIALAFVEEGCDPRKIVSGVDVPTCIRCHGGLETRDGAPPLDVHGNTATTAVGVGAHTAHLQATHDIAAPLACEACHERPTLEDPAAHIDGTAAPRFGVLARARGVATWDRTAATCNVYCHGGSLAGGSARQPVWTRVDGTQIACGGCHGAPPPEPHPQRPECWNCHPGTMKVGGGIDLATGQHVDGALQVEVGCTDCHGDESRTADAPLLRSAPPEGTHRETATSARAVGAHQSHLIAGHVAGPVACVECHEVLSDPLHANGTVELRWGPRASAGTTPAWNPTDRTCTSTYCHGATLGGGTNTAPVWTVVDGSQRACGTCHGAPPPSHAAASIRCAVCHPGTVKSDGTINVGGGMHLDGTIEVNDIHPDGWATPTSHGHAADRDLASCKVCHGDDLGGGATGISCDACHAAHGSPDWKTKCTFCHGDANRTTNAAAPPAGVFGETATTDRAVGAHQRHLGGGLVSGPFACTECHALPLDLSHLTGAAELVWGPLATGHGAVSPVLAQGGCSSTYCHGATLGGGTVPAPLWTRVDGTQAACGSCHGTPPPAPHPQLTSCAQCHPETMLDDRTINVAGGKHVDGIVERQSYHPSGWATPSVHGLAANADLATCKGCHGADLSGGGTGVSCASCHGASWQSNCTFCHGTKVATYRSSDLPSAAPPQGTQNETVTTSVAVGAHQSHVRAGPLSAGFGCAVCHAVPASLDHVNGVATVSFGFPAGAGGPAPQWNGTSCTTYCHGATLGGGSRTNPSWTRVDGTEAACGTCHGLPPPAPHPQNPGCGNCHDGYTPASVNPVTHVNGQTDVKPLACSSCHGDPTRIGPALLQAAPPIGTRGETATTARAVGAHQLHLVGSAIAGPVACTECHPVATSIAHANLAVDLAFGPLASAGGAQARWSPDTLSCSVYCHGATLAGGSIAAPVWTVVNGSQMACTSCHGAPPETIRGNPPRLHSVNPRCGSCHPGYTSSSANPAAHVNGVVDVLPFTCSSCHGDPDRSGSTLAKAAPPLGAQGETATTSLAVGAHLAHVQGSVLSNGYECSMCHAVPATMDHSNGVAELSFGALATKDGAPARWDRAAGTCSSTYCHGQFAGGALTTAPSWIIVDGSQAACGTCHGVPPPSPHIASLSCGSCHQDYTATTVNRALHANGTIEASASHPDGWEAPTSHGHAADRDLAGCKVCHGEDLGGGASGISCNACHAAHGSPDWKTKCTFCHGDANRTTNAAAPPAGVFGETATTDRAVGAHQRHLGGLVSGPFACTECHAVPLDLSHLTGAAELAWGPLATGHGAVSPVLAQGGCSSTYCHGATLGGGTVPAPLWTRVDGTQAACGSCHGTPPPAPHPQLTSCAQCHPETMLDDRTINVAGGKHVDGIVERQSYHPSGWATPSVHGLAANADLATCKGCHGADLSGGGTGVSCASCHGASWQSNCTFCHGTKVATYRSSDLPSAAPPQGTQNETATTAVAVGAHQSHVRAGPLSAGFGCAVCHAVPASLDHVNGVATVSFGFPAGAGGPAPQWNGTSCTTYCHGATLGGGSRTNPSWTRVDGTQAACGTCHGLPPPAPHPQHPGCGNCHDGYGPSSVNPATHVNGSVEVLPVACSSCHGDRDRTGSTLAKAAPPLGAHGETATTSLAVGAHLAHVQGSVLANGYDCSACHTAPGTMDHANGVPDVSFGTLATKDGAPARWDRAAGTCSSTYCHGQFAGGALTNAPSWTIVDGSQAACGTCHGVPPPSPHTASLSCGNCHQDYSATSVNRALHANGTVDVLPLTCTSCHGDPSRPGDHTLKAAPPTGSRNETETTQRAVGAHQVHLLGRSWSTGFACTECHTVPTSPAHENGIAELTWGPLARTAGAVPSWNGTTCATTYCHGATMTTRGTNKTPTWTGGAAGCGACHEAPPATFFHQWHRLMSCAHCHGAGYSSGTVNPTLHVDGVLQAPACEQCHGDE